MSTLVIYDTKFGNTERIAEAIARGVGSVSDVHVMSTTEVVGAVRAIDGRPDLLFVGGPTQNHGPSAGLRDFINALPASLAGVPAVCFDTRYRGPVLLMGSAASAAAKALAKAGAEIVAKPESFFIARRGQMPLQALEPGEIERAEQWGREMAAAASPAATSVGSAARVEG
jgi:flavodoxin